MAGFSNSIKRLSSSWVNQKEKQTLKKRKKSIWFWKNNKKAALSNQYRKIKEKI